MSDLSSIDKEIAKLEAEQKNSQKKLDLLKKSKKAMLKQAKENRKLSKRLELDELIESANEKLAETSLQFLNDNTLEAVLIKLDDSHVSEYILTDDLDLKMISKFLDLFSRNVKTIEKIFNAFNESTDLVRIDYDDKTFKSITFNIFGREYSINIVAKDDEHLTVKLTTEIDYRSDRVIIKSEKIEYEISMDNSCNSYDSFNIDASVSDKCSIEELNKTLGRLSFELDKAEVEEL